ncbi:MAG: hypothetical protein B7C24_15575, partial [Bacteroidetes bacterium 4572_77]
MSKFLPKAILASFMILVFFMPVFYRITPILIGVLAVFILIDAFYHATFDFTPKNIILLGVSFFGIHLLSVFYSDFKEVAWEDVGIKFSLLLFPLLFMFKNPSVIKQKAKVLWAFVAGVLMAGIMMLARAFWVFDGQDISVFFYTKLSLFHPSYMAMYFVFSILILIDFVSAKKRRKPQLIGSMLAFSFLLVFVMLLQSKGAMLSLLVILVFYILYALWRKNKSIFLWSISLLLVFISLIYFQPNSRIKTMNESIEKMVEEDAHITTSTGVRYEMWRVCLNAVSEHWAFGVGSGDIKPVLFKRYEVQKLEDAINNNYNVHNQYLETFLGQGIIGIGLLLALLVLAFRQALMRKSLLLSGFVLLISVSIMPESMLNRQIGVVFIAFFFY